MTNIFDIQPSKILCRCLLGLHIFAAITVSLFFIPLIYKWMLIGFLAASAGWQVYRWKERRIRCEFNANKDQWRVSNNHKGWQLAHRVDVVYVTEHLIWLNFYTINRRLVTVMVGADSLEACKLLQLRRSVICPAVLRACSS